jgi:hypothetical protein
VQNNQRKVTKLLLAYPDPFNFRSLSILLVAHQERWTATFNFNGCDFFICADVSHRVPRTADMLRGDH